MQAGQPSRTAISAATHRAAHQILEQGRIFADPLALAILGDGATEARRQDESRRGMRLFIAARTRFAEDSLARAVSRGTRQLVILGAGLDTFAYRNPHGNLRIFEVDHPATQEWKRRRLAEAKISAPSTMSFVPVDFEHEVLMEKLIAAGFDPERPGFFTWLGVVPYLTEQAVFGTLTTIAQLQPGTEIVFDYSDPLELLLPASRAAHDERATRVAKIGEPWITYFEPSKLAERLAALGFTEIHDLGPQKISRLYFATREILRERGGHVVLARTT